VPHPPKLTRDGRVAVFAPASAPPDPRRYRDGLAALRQRGLHVAAPDHVPATGYLAGPDDLRLDRLNELFRRDDIDAIICARGGYGTLRLLDGLDYDAIAARPKLIVGYSDITALQLALLAQCGLPSLSGAMVAPDWSRMDDFSESSFWTLAGGGAPVAITNPRGAPLLSIRRGDVSGPLIGGNLTMVAALLGSDFLPDLTGAILYVEEVGEAPYRIDRLFAQLALAGVLEEIGGLVLGAFTDCNPEPGRPSLALKEIIHHYAAMVDGPVVGGLVYGHLRPKPSLPVGVQAHLEAAFSEATLTVTEPLTR
jgi:muramoyltetrapeptide carboxypeptidase